MRDYEKARVDLMALIETTDLTVQCTFVPFSQSRNRAEKHLSLNWRCNVLRNGRQILSGIDYMQGIGHAPSHKKPRNFSTGKVFTIAQRRAERIEAESGKIACYLASGGEPKTGAKPIAAPSAVDIISALAMDSDVLNYATYEEWGSDLGFDPYSRKGEAIYRLCLSHALALRAALGEATLTQLSELAREM